MLAEVSRLQLHYGLPIEIPSCPRSSGAAVKPFLVFLSLMFLWAVRVSAEEPLGWPRFRGPNGSGIADGQKPPVEFGPEKNAKWKVPAPAGISSPIIAGDNLVITGFDDGKLYTVAYRRRGLADRRGRVHSRHRWRADRLVFRFVWSVLL